MKHQNVSSTDDYLHNTILMKLLLSKSLSEFRHFVMRIQPCRVYLMRKLASDVLIDMYTSVQNDYGVLSVLYNLTTRHLEHHEYALETLDSQ